MNAIANEFATYDRDDLIGIALGVDDPLYLESVHYKCLEENVVDDSGVDGSLTAALDRAVETEAPEEIDFDFSDIEPEDDDVTVDGMEVEDLADSDEEIINGLADDDIDYIDFIDIDDEV